MAGPQLINRQTRVAKGYRVKAAVGMPYEGRSSRVRRPSWDADNDHVEVSSLVMKAYAVSLLLLASVLVWTTLGDAWMHYGSPSPLDSSSGGFSNFTALDFAN